MELGQTGQYVCLNVKPVFSYFDFRTILFEILAEEMTGLSIYRNRFEIRVGFNVTTLIDRRHLSFKYMAIRLVSRHMNIVVY